MSKLCIAYEYIMTYSFPCQDLSKSGKGRGMKKEKEPDQVCFGRWRGC